MSWTYSNNPADSKIDECRFMIGDTDESNPIMQDEEILYLVNTYPDKDMLSYQLFLKAATIFARDVKRSLGPMSEDPTERLKFFKEQADYFKKRTQTTGLSLPAYAAPKAFRKGMQNNPPIGGARYV